MTRTPAELLAVAEFGRPVYELADRDHIRRWWYLPDGEPDAFGCRPSVLLSIWYNRTRGAYVATLTEVKFVKQGTGFRQELSFSRDAVELRSMPVARFGAAKFAAFALLVDAMLGSGRVAP